MTAAATGVAAVDGLAGWAVALAAISGLVALLWRVIALLVRGLRRLDDIADDWTGTPARPGVPARPGALERIGGIESAVCRMDERLRVVEGELTPNGGDSTYDRMRRVDQRTAQMAADSD